MASLLAGSIVAFLVAGSFVMALRRPAKRFGFVDCPGGRKQHRGAVPLVGGLAVVLGTAAALPVVPVWPPAALVAGMGLLLGVGLVDDARGMRSATKFAFQVLAAVFMVSWGQGVLTSLGHYPFVGEFELGAWAVPFTLVAVVGLINGVNMMDGADGLAGGLCLTAFAWLLVIAGLTGQGGMSALLAPLLGALAGFLIFNMRNPWRRKACVFLGDAGSMTLGFALAWFAVALAQAQTAVSPVGVAWVVALPVIDTLSLMARRIQKKQSPFAADREHLHHIFQRAGYGPGQTAGVLVAVGAVMGGIGVGGSLVGVPDGLLALGLVLAGMLHFVFIKAAWRTMKALKRVEGRATVRLGGASSPSAVAPVIAPGAAQLALAGLYVAVAMVPFSAAGVVLGFAGVLAATLWAAPAFLRDARRLPVAWVALVLSAFVAWRGVTAPDLASGSVVPHWGDVFRIGGVLALPLAWWLARFRTQWPGLFLILLAAGAVGLALRVDWRAVNTGAWGNPFAMGDPATSGFISTGVLLLLLAGMVAATRRLHRGWRHRFQLGVCLLVSVPMVFLLVASQYTTGWVGLLTGAVLMGATAVWHGISRRQWAGLAASVGLIAVLWLGFWSVLTSDAQRAELVEPLRAGVLVLQGEPEAAAALHPGTVERLALWGRGLEAWARAPVLGSGLAGPVGEAGGGPSGEGSYRNLYLSVGVGFGLVGVGLFAVLALLLMRQCVCAVADRVWPGALGMALLSVTGAAAVMLFFSVQVDALASRSALIMLTALLAAAGFERLWWRDAAEVRGWWSARIGQASDPGDDRRPDGFRGPPAANDVHSEPATGVNR